MHDAIASSPPYPDETDLKAVDITPCFEINFENGPTAAAVVLQQAAGPPAC